MDLKILTPQQRKYIQFIHYLIASIGSQWFVAYKMWLSGHRVTINPMRITPPDGDNAVYTDRGDLEVEFPDGWKHIEVKQIRACFRDRKSFPFKNALVDRVNTYQKKKEPVYAYVVVSHDYKALYFVHVEKTRMFWFEQELENGMYKGTKPWRELYYFIPPDKAIFIETKNTENWTQGIMDTVHLDTQKSGG